MNASRCVFRLLFCVNVGFFSRIDGIDKKNLAGFSQRPRPEIIPSVFVTSIIWLAIRAQIFGEGEWR